MVSLKTYSADYHHDEDYSRNNHHTVWLADRAPSVSDITIGISAG